MTPFHIVLVPVDFSEASPDTLDAALELARGDQRRLHLLHVVPDVFRTPGMAQTPAVDWHQVQGDWIDTGRQQLIALAANRKLDPQKVTVVIAVGRPADEIVTYASEHAVDAVVLGAHGNGRVRRFMLGSTADGVVRQASCPVMLVPHKTVQMTSFEVKAASGIES